MTPQGELKTADVLHFPLNLLDTDGAADVMRGWAEGNQSRVVLAANVHMVMEARDDPALRTLLREADLSVPDGRPLVWALRLLGIPATHVRGSDLTKRVCEIAEAQRIPLGLYGGTPETLAALRGFLDRAYPRLAVTYAVSPPFRTLSQGEDSATVDDISTSGARILLVALGCPKQERWMMAHRGLVPCVMIGVGAAFDFLAGTAREAPRWMQRSGLEWLFRLASEPRRLWRRYLKHNPRFVLFFALQWLGHIANGGRDSSRGT